MSSLRSKAQVAFAAALTEQGLQSPFAPERLDFVALSQNSVPISWDPKQAYAVIKNQKAEVAAGLTQNLTDPAAVLEVYTRDKRKTVSEAAALTGLLPPDLLVEFILTHNFESNVAVSTPAQLASFLPSAVLYHAWFGCDVLHGFSEPNLCSFTKVSCKFKTSPQILPTLFKTLIEERNFALFHTLCTEKQVWRQFFRASPSKETSDLISETLLTNSSLFSTKELTHLKEETSRHAAFAKVLSELSVRSAFTSHTKVTPALFAKVYVEEFPHSETLLFDFAKKFQTEQKEFTLKRCLEEIIALEKNSTSQPKRYASRHFLFLALRNHVLSTRDKTSTQSKTVLKPFFVLKPFKQESLHSLKEEREKLFKDAEAINQHLYNPNQKGFDSFEFSLTGSQAAHIIENSPPFSALSDVDFVVLQLFDGKDYEPLLALPPAKAVTSVALLPYTPSNVRVRALHMFAKARTSQATSSESGPIFATGYTLEEYGAVLKDSQIDFSERAVLALFILDCIGRLPEKFDVPTRALEFYNMLYSIPDLFIYMALSHKISRPETLGSPLLGRLFSTEELLQQNPLSLFTYALKEPAILESVDITDQEFASTLSLYSKGFLDNYSSQVLNLYTEIASQSFSVGVQSLQVLEDLIFEMLDSTFWYAAVGSAMNRWLSNSSSQPVVVGKLLRTVPLSQLLLNEAVFLKLVGTFGVARFSDGKNSSHVYSIVASLLENWTGTLPELFDAAQLMQHNKQVV